VKFSDEPNAQQHILTVGNQGW